jgi:heme-degrading monooxygenase HmoA
MQKVLIDLLIVPEEARATFLENNRKVQAFLKTLPGFVEGYLYEKTDGSGQYNIITTAVWENETALENAKDVVKAEFQRLGFNPQEMMSTLKIQSERVVCERFPY